MLVVYNCIAYAHDLRLVGLAALMCALASFTAIMLLHHVRKSTGRTQSVWLAVSAVASGFGIWATHFIGMLAFSPGIPSAYDMSLTVLSLVAAIVLTGIGFALALSATLPAAAPLGGMILGGGIAVMHYTGMAAFEIEGRLVWEPVLVAASVALGVILATVALTTGLRGTAMKWRLCGALLLTAAICGLHFTAMGAVSVVPDPEIVVSASALPTSWMALAVALASVTIIALAFAGLALDVRDRRLKLEGDRMRGLANAAVEGLIVCRDRMIATANDNFIALLGASGDDVIGARLGACFLDGETVAAKLLARPHQPMEADLRRRDGSLVPVELILHSIDVAGKPHQAIAVRDLTARRQAEEHIRFLAHNDPLTGLPNRSAFYKKVDLDIEVALDTGQPVAVLCLDLDRFKEVNDLFGHAAGDLALQAIARTVSGLLDPTQMMARLGSDEFAVILPAISGPAVAARVAENILEALRVENASSPATAFISASIGIALCPNDATDRHMLLSHADAALCRAKSDERGVYRFFEATIGAEVRERRLLEHDLRHALSRGELSLVYQPQEDIRSGEITGFEALVRWKHPTRGDISPAVFIPLAEESGMIIAIGEWVLRTACGEAARWTRPVSVAVNVSAIQLHNADFTHRVHEILLQTGMAAHRLELEITETALIRDLTLALSTLRQVKALGVRIAMDDFGTGYSSLSNLLAFPFDKIKIDRSFIKSVETNGQAATIVRAVLGLGRGLGLPVLAEGIETAGEFNFLANELCSEGQGYLIGRPAGIENFRHLTEAAAMEAKTARSSSVA